LVSQLFALRNNQAKQSQTLSYKFRAELKELTDELGSCDVHFIRCIKPNELNARDTFNSRYVMAQIRYLGLLENVRIKRVGHGYKLTLVQFIDKYACSNQPSRDIGLSQLKKKEPHEIIKHLEENLLA
jgi:myosin heavy subunit